MSDLHLIGTELDDTLVGAEGNDWLEGLAGNDTLIGNEGDDTLDGGDDTDAADYSSSSSSVMVHLVLGTATGAASGTDTLVSIENIVGSNFDDLLIGDALDNALLGQAGNDTLIGGEGSDTLDGGFGVFDFSTDTADYSGAGSAVIVNLTNGSASGTATGMDVLQFINGVIGSAFDDVLIGTNGNNVLAGGLGTDNLLGQGGSDTLTGGQDNDTLDGGEGIDFADYSAAGAAVNVDLATQSASGAATGTDVLLGIEHALGSVFDDALTGNADANSLFGGVGADELLGQAGNDTLDGGDDNDTLFGGDGNDNLNGGDGNDVINGGTGSGSDILSGGAGNDAIAGGTNVSIEGGDGDDQITFSGGTARGGEGSDTIQGGTQFLMNFFFGDGGDDLLLAGPEFYILNGGDGDDTLVGGPSLLFIPDSILGGSGNDSIVGGQFDRIDAGSGDDIVTAIGGIAVAGEGNDTVSVEGSLDTTVLGESGSDSISGGAGADSLDGGSGSDSLTGGDGDDVYVFDDVGDFATEQQDEGIDLIRSSVTTVLGDHLENLTLLEGAANGIGNIQNNVIVGNSASNELDGGAGSDKLEAHADNDVLDGGSGVDHMIGGAGDDTYVVDSLGPATSLLLQGAPGSWVTGGQGFFLTDATKFSVQSTSDLTGDGEVDFLRLQYLSVLGEFWFLDFSTNQLGQNLAPGVYLDAQRATFAQPGHPGLDVAGNGNGSNIVFGNFTIHHVEFDYSGSSPLLVSFSASFEQRSELPTNPVVIGRINYNYLPPLIEPVVELPDNGIDSIQSHISAELPVNVENLELLGSADLNGTGNDLDNVITGNNGANELSGAAGNDTLVGNQGNDTLIGGPGDDTLDGGDGIDTADYSNTLSAVIVNLVLGTATGQASGTDTLVSIENIVGSNFDDLLIGNAAANAIFGLDGNDWLIGGLGDDILDGGAGLDTADYSGAGAAVSVDLSAGSASGAATGTDVLVAIKNVFGSAFDDSLIGNTDANTLWGYLGNDTLDGGDGNDLLLGGPGNDFLAGQGGNDSLFGDDSDDTLTGGDGDDTLDGGNGHDSLAGGTGNDTYFINDSSGGPTSLTIHNWLGDGQTYSFNLDTGTFTPKVFDLAADGQIDYVSLDYRDFAFPFSGRWFNLDFSTTQLGIPFAPGNYPNAERAASASPGHSGLNVGENGGGFSQLSGSFIVTAAEFDYSGSAPVLLALSVDFEQFTFLSAVTGSLDYNYAGAGPAVHDSVMENPGGGIDTVLSRVSYTLPSNVENLTLTGSAGSSGSGNELDNTIEGNAGNNALSGDAGNDSLSGGVGMDVLDGGAGSDILEGGSGDDTYVIDDSVADLVIEDPAAGFDTVMSAASYALTITTNVEILTLTGNADINGAGNESANILNGNTGANVLTGGAGSDRLLGGVGNDVLDGGADLDALQGGSGDDTYVINEAVLLGGSTSLTMLSEPGDFIGQGLTYSFDLTTGTFTPTLLDLNADGQVDLVRIFYADLEFPPGNNFTLEFATSTRGTALTPGLYLDAESWTRASPGQPGFDVHGNGRGAGVFGNFTVSAVDIDYSGPSPILRNLAVSFEQHVENFTPALFGTLIYNVAPTGASSVDSVIENVGEGTDTVMSAVTYTLPANVENLVLTGGGNINGTGNALDNVITGNNGANELSGVGGNDTLNGGLGADSLTGGAGDDTYVIDDTGDTVVENAGEGTDTVQSTLAIYTLTANVENLTLVGSAVEGLGNALDNVITGNSAANGLYGAAGTDTLIGGLGDDIYVAEGADVVIEQAGEGNDTVYSLHLATYTLTANVENLTLLGSAVEGLGNALDNVITGNSAANGLYGDLGTDTLIGGLGNDIYVVEGADVVIEQAGGGSDTVYSLHLATYTLTANVENLTLLGSAVEGLGNALDNVITGNSAANALYGDLGNDTLSGGLGDDLYVVGGSDVVIEQANGGADTVYSLVSYTLAANVENLILLGSATMNATGNALNNALTGNSGSNTLNGGLGADSLSGGAGNDILIWDAADTSRQGGEGSDSLQVNGAGNAINLTALADGLITDVEIFNITGSGNNALTLGLADVLAISSTTDTLRIDGNAGDLVNAGSGWTQGANQAIGGNTYATYAQDLATLLVDTDITRNIS